MTACDCAVCGGSTADPRPLCDDCFLELVEPDAEAQESHAPRSLLTLAEVAGVLHTAPKTVRRLIAAGHLHAVEITLSASPNGRRYRVSRKALARFLHGCVSSRRPVATPEHFRTP